MEGGNRQCGGWQQDGWGALRVDNACVGDSSIKRLRGCKVWRVGGGGCKM